MTCERTIPHRLLAAAGWLYAIAGRERCDVCGGPLPAGEIRTVTRDVPFETVDTEVTISLCKNCDTAYWVLTNVDDGQTGGWYHDLWHDVCGASVGGGGDD